MDDLVALPGVGRKTANVVLGVMWNIPEGVVVDTHVGRITQRLGWTKNSDPTKIEQDLVKLLPQNEWDQASHILIFHGRRICFAIKPNCEGCGVNDVCPCAFKAEKVGRKNAPPRKRPKAAVKSR
jgi:endonuclease-3